MNVLERFLRYVSYDTQSDEHSETVPSTDKQRLLGAQLVEDLKEIGIQDAQLDAYGYVYGNLPATPGCEHLPVCCLIAHMDTSPDAPGASVRARVVDYHGGDVVLNEAQNIVLSPKEFPSLNQYQGQHLVVTDGTTLLGADDKAGLAEIVTAVAYLMQHPELPHGRIALAFTPDEEVGRGADHFDLQRVQADYGYTVDGGALGELEYENFNAAHAEVQFYGRNIHPGEGKDKLINAVLMVCEFVNLLPAAQTPAHTEGYEGFFHVNRIEGEEGHAMVHLLIRDHNRDRFEDRKRVLQSIVTFLNQRWGQGRVALHIQDSYYNMREKIEPHMELIHRAEEAFRKAGVTPRVVPIRGGTDGARLSYEGLPCPNLSTGGLNYHGVYEYVPVESMEAMVKVLVHLVTREPE